MPASFHPDDIRIDLPTRDAPLKWVVIVDEALPPGRALNAAACVAAAAGHAVGGLLGPGASDASGSEHEGLPWAGCTLLEGAAAEIAEARDKASAWTDAYVADMPVAAQETRVYADFLDSLTSTNEPVYAAVTVVGPKNRIAKLVKRFSLVP